MVVVVVWVLREVTLDRAGGGGALASGTGDGEEELKK